MALTLLESPSRKREHSHDLDPTQVLDAALALFWRQGYRATTMRGLEQELGLSQSTLYNAFGSKRGLLEAALDRYMSLAFRTLIQPLAMSPQGLGAIETFVVSHARWLTEPDRRGCLLVNLMTEESSATELIDTHFRTFRQRLRTLLLQALVRAAAKDEIEDVSLEARADLLVGLVLGMTVASRSRVPRAELDATLRGMFTQLQAWRTASTQV